MSFVTMMEGHLAWGDKPLLDNADLAVEPGQRIGLIGRNGTGKSSLLKVLAGIEKLDGGELHTQNGLHAVYVEQEPYFPEAPTVMDSLVLRGKLDELPDEKMRWQIQSRLSEFLHKFGLDENLDLKKASGGEKKKAALALAFALDADLLLLDEPTNHLDIDAIRQLENIILNEFKKSRSFVTITHDRAFLNRIVDTIWELDRGVVRSYPGSFEAYQRRKEEELAAEDKARLILIRFGLRKKPGFAAASRRAAHETRVASDVWSKCVLNVSKDEIGSAKSILTWTPEREAAKSWPSSWVSVRVSATAA